MLVIASYHITSELLAVMSQYSDPPRNPCLFRELELACCVGTISLYTLPPPINSEKAENGLQSRSSENGKTRVWHYGLKLQ